MHVARRTSLFGNTIIGLAIAAWFGLLAGCAPIQGFPKDPEDTDATLAALTPYFNGAKDQEYFDPRLDPKARALKRNEIILARVHAYDIEFADFEKRLYGDGNGVTLGGDLVGLVLAGLTATTGNAATKAALGAASAGVIGAKSAIDKDLYYQKTIPALLAQMEADRLKALAPIIAKLTLSDADYPLMQAYIDLDAYKDAGSIPAAINTFNKDAGNAKAAALDALRSTPFTEDTYSDRLVAYIWPSGVTKPANQTNLKKLQQWMNSHTYNGVSLSGVPIPNFLHAAALADQRKQAVGDLSIP